MRGGVQAQFSSGESFATIHAGSLWRDDPDRPDLLDGGFVLRRRIVFTILKSAQATPFAIGDIVRCDQASGAAFIIEAVAQQTADHISHRYEARRSA